MQRFWFPVQGLSLEDDWTFGTARLHDVRGGKDVLARFTRGAEARRADVMQFHPFKEALSALDKATVAEVEADTIEAGIEQVGDALDVLRVFQYWRAGTRTTMFGLSGELRLAHIPYLRMVGEAHGAGFTNTGEILGTTFSKEEHEVFDRSIWGRVARLPVDDQTEGATRVRLAVRMLSQAVREHRPPMRQLATVIAVETLLGGGGKSYRLAQRAVFFTCGQPQNDLCGRSRPTCDFLGADLTTPRGVKRTERLTEQANEACDQDLQGVWVCSEWLNAVERYDDRSGVAHGDPSLVVNKAEASGDLYWSIKRLAVPAITWLLDHADQPVVDLDAEILALRPVQPAAQ